MMHPKRSNAKKPVLSQNQTWAAYDIENSIHNTPAGPRGDYKETGAGENPQKI